jgi:hypothetical protein
MASCKIHCLIYWILKRISLNRGKQQQRGSEILDEDARRMLKDCQEYLLGAFHQRQGSADHSPHPPPGHRSVRVLKESTREYLLGAFHQFQGSADHSPQPPPGHRSVRVLKESTREYLLGAFHQHQGSADHSPQPPPGHRSVLSHVSDLWEHCRWKYIFKS